MKCYLLLPAFFVSALITVKAYAQPADTAKIAAVEKNLVGRIQVEGDTPGTISGRMQYYHVKAMSVAVIANYEIAWTKAWGWADDSLKIPATPQTLFQAASISKSLNAVGVLKLVQDKKLDLYADINNYLTTWKFPYDSLSKGKKISMANLLSHTGGLTVHGFEGYTRGKPLPTLPQVLDGTKGKTNSDAVRSMYAPGIKSEYSGGGIEISQMIVMDITRQPYDKYMYDNVLKPLGMTGSTYQQPPVDKDPTVLATAYRADGKRVPGGYNVYPEQAAAGLWTNPADLAKYIIETQLALEGRSHKVLNQETTRLRLTPYIDKEAALGVFVIDDNGAKYFTHGGANEGFRSVYWGSMEGGNGVVVMVNSDNGDIMNEVINSVAKVYGFKGLGGSKLVKTVPVADSILQSYTGEYQLTPNYTLTISKEGSRMYGQGPGQAMIEIFPETENKFFAKETPAEIEFVKGADGKVVKLVVNGAQEGKKVK